MCKQNTYKNKQEQESNRKIRPFKSKENDYKKTTASLISSNKTLHTKHSITKKKKKENKNHLKNKKEKNTKFYLIKILVKNIFQ